MALACTLIHRADAPANGVSPPQEVGVNMVFAVKIRLANPDHLLKPGMPADVVIGP